jgi:hypothetical protein
VEILKGQEEKGYLPRDLDIDEPVDLTNQGSHWVPSLQPQSRMLGIIRIAPSISYCDFPHGCGHLLLLTSLERAPPVWSTYLAVGWRK